jgi:SET domain-containing protein
MTVRISPSSIPDAGLGVFACRPIRMGEIIEECCVIPFDNGVPVPENTALWDYQLAWLDGIDAIASGAALFYNHSDMPNATAVRDIENRKLEIIAISDIDENDEIFVLYKCDPWW